MGVAHQSGVHPILDIAVAAPRLHRAGRDRDIVAGGAELQERRQDARELRRLAVAGFPGGEGRRDEHRHGERLFGRDHQLQKLPPHQRLIDDATAEGDPIAGDGERLVQAAPHHRGGPHAMRETRHVHLVEHALQAVIGVRSDLAEGIGHRAFEHDLARRHRPGAELVLEPDDPVAVAPSVFQPPRHGEEREAGIAGGRAGGPRQEHGDVAVRAGAEPLVSVEAPRAVLEAGFQFDAADVRAAGLLRHELRAHQPLGAILAQHARHEAVRKFGRAVPFDQERRRLRRGDRTHQAELRLHEEILEGVLRDGRDLLRPAEHAGPPRHAMNAEAAERDVLHFPISRMEFDLVLVPAIGVAGMQGWLALVRHAGQPVEPSAGDFAEFPIVRQHVRQKIGRQIEVEQALQAAVDLEEVLALAVRRDAVAVIAARRRHHRSVHDVLPEFGEASPIRLDGAIESLALSSAKNAFDGGGNIPPTADFRHPGV